MSRYIKVFGENVQQQRQQRGWTQAVLAKRIGVSVPYISRLENGRGNLTVMQCEKVARAVGRPLEDLFRRAA